jgi:hypothetical protein
MKGVEGDFQDLLAFPRLSSPLLASYVVPARVSPLTSRYMNSRPS